ncbi:MAG TPA: C39 family peptidase [Candidatus Sulfotelmatobacter sp.]|nr:C39 family peptidase [Candidatus Sulfotelmatobacter sp.]
MLRRTRAGLIAFAAVVASCLTPAVNSQKIEHATAAATENEFTPPPNVAGQSAWISLRHQAQETNLCVPTSASIILDYFGDQVSPREIKELSMGRRYSPDKPFNDFSITLFRDLISGLDRIGYSWKERDYADDPKGMRRGIADIEHSLDGGLPVMIDTTPVRQHTSNGGGHTFVVAGYSVSQQAVYVVDPNVPAPGTRVIAFRELESIWNSRGVNFDKRGAVFPRRRRGKH